MLIFIKIQDITRRVEAIEGHSFWQDSELGNLGLASNRLESQQDQLDSRVNGNNISDREPLSEIKHLSTH